MVHAAHEGAKTCPHSLDLRGKRKLELSVDFVGMLQAMPISDAFVDARPIGEQVAVRFRKTAQELNRVRFVRVFLMEHLEHHLAGAFLFRADDCSVAGKHLVAGNTASQQNIKAFPWYVRAKLLVP